MRIALPSDRASILPAPDADALAHTRACADMLRAEIAAAGGWISFARFMDRALYAPGLGYYAAGARKFGAAGDFVTAPEISPLFGRCLARAIEDLVRGTQGDVLELGPGSGKLARDVLLELDACGALPNRYLMLEVSADLRDRQRALLRELPGHLFERIEWCDSIPDLLRGAVLANEVLDVIPIHLLLNKGGSWQERGVIVHGEAFAWEDRVCSDALLIEQARSIETQQFAGSIPEGYIVELCPQAAALVSSVGAAMQEGAMLWIDYGFRLSEFYHPSRYMGTLMCHYRHYAHPDPFLYPGLQDITAHVDFSSIARAGAEAGLTLAGYTSQAQFLIAAGLPNLLPRDAAPDAHMRMAQQIQRLTSPAEMGELFKVIGFAKGGVEIPTFIKARPLPL
jgi:SAM-dependent MidA family methyltransferase